MYTVNIPELVQIRETVLVYPGGCMRPPQTIFKELEIANIKTAEKKDTITLFVLISRQSCNP